MSNAANAIELAAAALQRRRYNTAVANIRSEINDLSFASSYI